MKRKNRSDRKAFIKKALLLSTTPFLNFRELFSAGSAMHSSHSPAEAAFPLVISTWKRGLAANEAAWKLLKANGPSLDAVEAGVRISESDPEVTSVGYGGLPDREGRVTLDACIMDSIGNCGSVSFLEHIKNPISVARKVMEDTDHIMLSGEGALSFALSKGFKKENLLTEYARSRWEQWKKSQENPDDRQNHDTIGMIALDVNRKVAGACTTSGLAWKMHGRVGDSPIIGAGMFVDGEVGGAAATGKGESVIKISGTHLIVELMRQGKHPQEACKEAIERIVKKQADYRSFQVGFIAANISGETGAYSIQPEFQYALYVKGENKLVDSEHYL